MKNKDIVYEGDTCPECGEGIIRGIFIPHFRMKCENCGASYNDRGERVPCENATAGY